MTKETKTELLRDKKVVEEINRHLWIESEKAGFDIGFDSAASDWLDRFSKAWMSYHLPKKAKPSIKKSPKTTVTASAKGTRTKSKPKKTRSTK